MERKMEDEIDLRDYIDVLVRRWKWIVGFTVLVVLVAGVVSFTMTPTYEATATLALTTLPSGQTVLTTLPSAAAQLTVLQSTEVAKQALQILGKTAAEENASTLARRVRVANAPQDKTLFRITAQADTPQKAAAIANAWAEAGLQELEQMQINALQKQIQALKASVETAQKAWQAAEEKLSAAEQTTQIEALKQELQSKQRLLETQQAAQESTRVALHQAQLLKEAVEQGQDAFSPEMLRVMQLVAAGSGASTILQISDIGSLTRSQQIDRLKAVILTLQARQQVLAELIPTLTTEITTLRKQVSERQVSLLGPTQARDAAQSDYTGLLQELQRARMSLSTSGDAARLVSSATPPSSPTQPRPLQNIALAGVVGLMLGVFGAFAAEYFAQPRPPRAT
jgi:uncharacterized protein involved in exopolysaccharide biosynthesis